MIQKNGRRRRGRLSGGAGFCPSAPKPFDSYVSFNVSLSDLQVCASEYKALWLSLLLKSGLEGVKPPLSVEGESCRLSAVSSSRDFDRKGKSASYRGNPSLLVHIELRRSVTQVYFWRMFGRVLGSHFQLGVRLGHDGEDKYTMEPIKKT